MSSSSSSAPLTQYDKGMLKTMMKTQIDQAITQTYQLEMQALAVIAKLDVRNESLQAAEEAEMHAQSMRKHWLTVRSQLDQEPSK
ncbi:hypothetical protein PSEUBRA_002991 [Kalmanozyma brasiliensis GHG001]|uniref:uncharacterized protein n=1 Tax=Kalmanozyma brasiliensis (strain GHG001) TaxID=1365824 RepID=UPI002867FEAC|nr:uncharacterized protein PSEUBRA_002991 [Kalmanozyma brasiliensis GHG001]KAF6767163.1 hypothetical protein PSEUBRA_002991 [Kalmanozyma brasiliensis GHG001]